MLLILGEGTQGPAAVAAAGEGVAWGPPTATTVAPGKGAARGPIAAASPGPARAALGSAAPATSEVTEVPENHGICDFRDLREKPTTLIIIKQDLIQLLLKLRGKFALIPLCFGIDTSHKK
ncbi:hypothetical protein UY3_11474 [Chelonia mydas]|uniref:Uncharacterized protein n=1 Tax=Chelonia mydas TaxID=8469 RepID=M7BTD0_CHEMY|nr:hypothetical protein UY3_11474 [Chelonia mydas]